MAEVTLRFHGRFLYADAYHAGARVDRISVVAPQFEPRGFGRHQAMMTIAHRDIQFQEDKFLLTTANPTFRVVAPSGTEEDLELLVWDLTGVVVTYDSTGATSMPQGRTEVLSLAELEGVQGRDPIFDQKALCPSSAQANAVIEISAGTGMTNDPGRDEPLMGFATEADVRAGNAQPLPDLKKLPADLVTFRVPFSKDYLTLTLTAASGETLGTIALTDRAGVGFSNSCAKIEEPPRADLEFTRYYDALTNRRKTDVLVPVQLGEHLIEGMRCYMTAGINFDQQS